MAGNENENTPKKPMKMRESLRIICREYWRNLLARVENKAASMQRKNVVIAGDWDNIKIAFLDRLDILDREIDWAKIIALAARMGNVIRKVLFTPMRVDYQLQELQRVYRFEISTSAVGKNGKDADEADRNMLRVIGPTLDLKRVDILIIIADDGDHGDLATLAIDRGIKVILMEIKTANEVLKVNSNIEIMPIPVKEAKSKEVLQT